MNKAELIDHISKVSHQTKTEVEKTLESFIDTTIATVARGEEVKLIGFGTFAVSERKERMGRNPQTGVPLQIPARKVPIFRPGKELKLAVNTTSSDS